MKLKFSAEAREDIRAEHAWWKANRPKSPLLLSSELRQAFTLIRTHPRLGKFVRGPDTEVLRLWHAQAGSEPKF